jgi:prepilin-type processing-associated H-X9-DG protein
MQQEQGQANVLYFDGHVEPNRPRGENEIHNWTDWRPYRTH